MTDQDLTAPEAVGRYRPSEFRMAPDSTGLWVRYSDYAALSAALEAERGINRGAQAWVDYHAARAEAAEARERALLTTYDQERKALVENTSLRSRLKTAEAKLKEAVDVMQKIVAIRDSVIWGEDHELARCSNDMHDAAEAFLASLEGDKP